MRLIYTLGVVTLLTSAPALAGGVDRSGQSIDFMFNSGNFIELSYAQVTPKVTATGNIFGNIASRSDTLDFAIKADLSEKLSFGIMSDAPYSADVRYRTLGLSAQLETRALTMLLRYKLSPSLALHGGGQILHISGAYDPLLPPMAPAIAIAKSSDTGFVMGASYEDASRATRATISYFSGTQLFDSTSNSTFNAPKAVNLGLQTGVAKDTLLFGKIRWAEWSDSKISVMGTDIVRFPKDTMTYSAGLGHRFTDALSAAVTVGYEAKQGGFAPALAPVDGSFSIGLGAEYIAGRSKIAFGLTHIQFGDTSTQGPPIVAWTGNSANIAAVKITHAF
jgi:long-chain fatty acid transport protein